MSNENIALAKIKNKKTQRDNPRCGHKHLCWCNVGLMYRASLLRWRNIKQILSLVFLLIFSSKKQNDKWALFARWFYYFFSHFLVRYITGKYQKPISNGWHWHDCLTSVIWGSSHSLHVTQHHQHWPFTREAVLNLNFHPLEVVSRYRDPQHQAGENYSTQICLIWDQPFANLDV